MPLYEYLCNGCNAVSTLLVYSWSEDKQTVCEQCGGLELERMVSKFSFRGSWGDSLNWAPSGESSRDVDENSPASIDKHMGRIKKEMGGQTTREFDRERRELSSGP